MLILNPQRNLLSQFILVSIIVAASSTEPTELIKSCLIQNNVMNFTVFQTSDYYKLLNFSIQNLRFTESQYPKPTAIVIPETKKQLAGTVLCSRQGTWTIRIRCGGHSYEGLSSIALGRSPFVIIDLMNLNRVSVDLESETAWVEGGATLGELYHEIVMSSASHGFSAGSCPTVGSGGHIAGGGFGLLSRKYGLAADNVLDAILVDANGRFLDKNAMGEDVFWAIRGGGGGVWGVVYAWKLKLVSVPPTVTAFVISRPGSRDEVANLVYKWQLVAPFLPDEFYLSAFVGAGLPEAKGRGISVSFKGFFLGTTTDVISILKEVFPELGIVQEDCHEMSWIESVVFFSDMDVGSTVADLKDRYFHRKNYFKAKSDYVRVPLPLRVIRNALEIFEKEPYGYVILDPYGGKMGRICNESIPFPHREGNLFTIQYLVSWNEEDDGKSDEFINWIRGFYDFMSPYVAKGPRAAYYNYLDLDLGVMMDSMNMNPASVVRSNDPVEMARAWGEKYFLHNYDRLVRAKTLIDPTNVFNNEQGIPPRATLSFQR